LEKSGNKILTAVSMNLINGIFVPPETKQILEIQGK
jgi:hypothetical protein